LGFLDKSCFTGRGSEPYAQTQTGGSGLGVFVTRRQGGPAIHPYTGYPF